MNREGRKLTRSSLFLLAFGLAVFLIFCQATREPEFSFLSMKTGATSVVVLFSLLQLRFEAKTQERCASLLFSMGIALYSFEGFLGFLQSRRNFLPVILSGAKYDIRTESEVALQAWKNGEQVLPRLPPLWVAQNGLTSQGKPLQPLSQVANSKLFDCNEDGAYRFNTSDEFGFHNPQGLWGESMKNGADLLLIGDSFTYGTCVSDDEDVGSQLRRTFPRTINLGQGGNGALLELASLMEYAPALRPKHVLWLYYENDLENLRDELKNEMLLKYLRQDFSQNLLHRQNEVDRELETKTRELVYGHNTFSARLSRIIASAWFNLKLYRIRQQLVALTPSVESDYESQEIYDVLSAAITKAKLKTEKLGGEFSVVYLPSWRLIRFGGNQDSQRKRTLEVLRGTGANVLDFSEKMLGERDPLQFFTHRGNAHYNREGYQFLADFIVSNLSGFSPATKNS